MNLHPFDPHSATHIAAATAIWNAACGPDLSFSERFMAFNTDPQFWSAPGRSQAGRLAVVDGQPVGLVLASAIASADGRVDGHVDAIAVRPAYRRRGIGRSLLTWAEDWLRGQGSQGIVLGASFLTFVPGPPIELNCAPFFAAQGYTQHGECVDMASDLASYTTPPTAMKAPGVTVRPAEIEDADALLSFLQREFPGGWHVECQELLKAGARISDYVLLWSDGGVNGCLLTTFEDSYRPLDRFYPHRLPRPWGQLGSVGVSADCRGLGYGAALMDGALRYLRDNGIRGCIIDWLVIVDFYAKFGFGVFRRYAMMAK